MCVHMLQCPWDLASWTAAAAAASCETQSSTCIASLRAKAELPWIAGWPAMVRQYIKCLTTGYKHCLGTPANSRVHHWRAS
jgi:hypothetical protein